MEFALKDINWALTENDEFLPFIFNEDKTKIKLILTDEIIVLKQCKHWLIDNIEKAKKIKIKDTYLSGGHYTYNMAFKLYYQQFVAKSFAGKYLSEKDLNYVDYAFDNLILNEKKLLKITKTINANYQKEVAKRKQVEIQQEKMLKKQQAKIEKRKKIIKESKEF